jgi:hypothetical protein
LRRVGLPAFATLALHLSAAQAQEPSPPEAAAPEAVAPRDAKEVVVRRVEREVGARRFEAVIHASGWVDERAIDYLAEGLRIVEVVPPDRRDLWALRSADAAVDPRADEITIALHALDGGDVRNVAWLPPDGFDVVRPAVLRLRPELAEGLAKAQDFRFRRAPLAAAREDRADAARPFTRMTGRIV